MYVNLCTESLLLLDYSVNDITGGGEALPLKSVSEHPGHPTCTIILSLLEARILASVDIPWQDFCLHLVPEFSVASISPVTPLPPSTAEAGSK